MTIVTTPYRYKRPPRRKKPMPLEVPAVVTAASKRRRVSDEAKAALAASIQLAPDDLERKPAIAINRTSSCATTKSGIVTARRPKAVNLPPGLLAETPEEHRRRGDAADALWRELARRTAETT